MKKTLFLIAIFASPAGILLAAPNAKPFVIPELREWTGGEGTLDMASGGRIVVTPEHQQVLGPVAKMLAEDIKTMFGRTFAVAVGQGQVNDIVLTLGSIDSDNSEAYKLTVSGRVEIKGNTATGVFWGTRTILQMLEQSQEFHLMKGTTLDYPKYPVRGFSLDCARKFFRIEFLNDYVKFMAYYKMNTFSVHLNDNGFRQFFDNDWDKTYAAFRLESTTYPGLTAKDGSYSKQEFIDLQKSAEVRGVNIIPEIDVPAHSLAFAHYLPEIGSKEYGMDHLDLFNPKTYEFLDGLFKEYLEGPQPVFRGKQVHVGTDEYSNRKKEVVEKFRYFTDYYIRYVEKFGKQAVVWGALTHAKGDTPVKSDNVLMYMWHNPYAQPRDMKKLGYDMISIPDGLLYIVPEAGYYYNYLNIKHLYNNWEPRNIGKETFDEGDPQIKGGMFAVWNDHVGNGISEKDVHHRVWPAMQTLAVKMWTGSQGLVPFDEFDKLRTNLSEAPGVNIMGTVKGKTGIVLEKAQLLTGEKTGLTEIGYGYRVEFNLRAGKNQKGATLFESPNAIVYMSDPKNGKLGFSRDGYLFTFDYTVPENQDVVLAIEGTSRSTKLYVNGTLQESLDIIKVPRSKDGKSTIAQVRTLVFPLEKIGKFQGELKNLKVSVL
ncbi:MAG: family 20 glycosylhydrolase [Puniceicoccales bacterium]|jgi:hexosaminidase|nr:family 20 glycosylhydrolase [Puniceicoccales bacterium]